MLSKVKKLDLPVDIQLGLYDQLVIPVLLYGCEIWGYHNLNEIELFQRKFLKNVLHISKFAANCMIYGETGRQPLALTVSKRMISFWHRIKFGKQSKMSSIIFQFMQSLYNSNTFKSKWCKKIKSILDEAGITYYWHLNHVNLNKIKSTLSQINCDTFLQNWSTQI